MRLNRLIREIFKERFPPKRAVFRVDAGRVRGLSFGHLCRCLTLAKELKRSAGTEIMFIMRNYKEGLDHAVSAGFKVKAIDNLLPAAEHDKMTAEFISKARPDCLVVDLPDENPEFYLRHAASNNVFTVCLDDVARRSYRADVILNSSILADRKKYRAYSAGTRFLLGMDYFIMDDYAVKKPRGVRGDRIFILLTFGGSDMTGLTRKVMLALEELDLRKVNFSAVLGPGFKERQRLIALSKSLRNKVAVLDYPRDIRGLFFRNDLVICAGGTTLYELYKLGRPCLPIASSVNEAAVIIRFVKDGLAAAGMAKWNRQDFLKRFQQVLSMLRKGKDSYAGQ